MNILNGYEIISKHIDIKKLKIDSKILGLIFKIVGLRINERSGYNFSRGIIQNLDAVKRLLLNINLWSNIGKNQKTLILESILGSLSEDINQFFDYNVSYSLFIFMIIEISLSPTSNKSNFDEFS